MGANDHEPTLVLVTRRTFHVIFYTNKMTVNKGIRHTLASSTLRERDISK